MILGFILIETSQFYFGDKKMNPSITDWITAISTLIIALGILITFWSIAADHKRSRRQRAIDMMLAWNSCRDLISDYIIRSLNYDQLKKLFDKEPFKVDKTLKPALDLFFLKVAGITQDHIKDIHLEDNNDEIILNEFCVSILKIYATKSINFLEIVASAWKNDVADEDIILEEFERVFFRPPRDTSDDISNYSGYIEASRVYPSMKAIIEVYTQKKKKIKVRTKKWYRCFL